MGFKKEATLSSGVVVEYWNIQEIRLNKERGFVDAKLQGFINQDAYVKGLDQVLVKSVRIAWDDFAEFMALDNMNREGSNIYSLVYEYAKVKDDFFEGAEDVIEIEKEKEPEETEVPQFVQPTGAHDTYQKGDQVIFEDVLYESVIDNNAYSPTAYPNGWKTI